MKWLSFSIILLCLVACRSKQTITTEQQSQAISLQSAKGIVQIDYYCSDSLPLLLTLDTMHYFRNLAKAQHKVNAHHERLILSTFTADTQRVSSAKSQEKVVVTKDRLFSFSYDDFILIVVVVLGVGLLLKLLR